MLIDVEIEDDIILDKYDKFLSKYNEWKRNSRDIKLIQLLESDKSIEFKIEDINLYGTSLSSYSDYLMLDLSTYGKKEIYSKLFIIDKIIFVIKGKYVKKISININIMRGVVLEDNFKIKHFTDLNDIIFYIDK